MSKTDKVQKHSRDWYRLDTAALIFPAIMRSNWSNAFRMSAELEEDIDIDTLQQAVNDLQKRFPSFYVRLRRGFFWYYLQAIEGRVEVQTEYAYPLTHMNRKELSKCCLRVLYYKNRIAVEFFHSLTDGHGGSIFLSSLVAHYIELRYGVCVGESESVLAFTGTVTKEELEDSFLKNSAGHPSSRGEPRSYHLSGTALEDGFLNITTGLISTAELVKKAHEYNCTVTAFLAAVMAESIIGMQEKEMPGRKHRPVKITVPVDLRRLYNSRTLRNFALTLNPGVDPRLGQYSLKELCGAFSHQIAADATPQKMAGMIAANVIPQKNIAIRLCPVFVKNIVMDMVYRSSGECSGSLNISNLGRISLPETVSSHVSRMDFVIGVQRSYPNNCSVLSYNDVTCINMIRNIRESELERRFFSRLVDLGIQVDIESNRR